MKLSIIIPCYNELNTIREIIEKVKEVKIEKEIIVVDDYSTDGSRELLELLNEDYGIKVFLNEKNCGKGATVIRGLNQATGDVMVIQDADLEYNPESFTKMLDMIFTSSYVETSENYGQNYQVVYGSRFLNSNREQKWGIPSHYIGNRILSFITSCLYFCWITDMETCYKMFTKEVWQKLNLESQKFDFEPEITAKIRKLGYKIKEVPIEYHPRSFTEGKKINWKDGIKALMVLIKWRFRK